MSIPLVPPVEGHVCPVPFNKYETVVIGHGSGGRLTDDLIKKYFIPHFSNTSLLAGNDFAELNSFPGGRLVTSTDAHIVNPLFFPGGDIGRLAVSGTINDLSMSGGIPLGLTASFILEEGFPIESLEKIIISMAETALEADVPIVAGDTKVVEKGKADGVFISTSGVAWVADGVHFGGALAQAGDAVLISGSIGDHGIAVLSARGEFGFESRVTSDVAPLNHLIRRLVEAGVPMHVLRDPTRGGLATTLNEIARQSQVNITINEDLVLVKTAVQSACEILGFDPLYVANEGKVIIILPQAWSEQALEILKAEKLGEDARQIGKVEAQPINRVLLKTTIGGTRLLDMMAGEMLPRIC